MTVRSPGRRPETSKRGPLPAIGQDAIAGQPFPPPHWRERRYFRQIGNELHPLDDGEPARTVRPAPPELLAKVMRDDEMLNALRRGPIDANREQFQRDHRRQFVWANICIAVALLVAAYFIGQYIRWAFFS